MGDALISVIMSVHNEEENLKNCIESILSQSYKNLEFIITDDCSTDKTSEIIYKYSKLDRRIIPIKNNENIGLTKSLNNMVHISKGRYIARQDGDDISISNRLEKQLNFISKKNLKVCSARALSKQNNKKIHLVSTLLPMNIVMRFKNPYIHGTLFIEKDTLLNVKLYNESFYYAQDYDLMNRLMTKNIKIGYVRTPLYILNTEDNISSNSFSEQKYYSDCVKKKYRTRKYCQKMKIYLNKANENWIVDRFRSEWYKYNSDISTRFINNADIIWVISPWTWNKINEKHLKNKKVVVTNHHIDLKNWNPNEKNNFYELDKFVDVYHTISNKSLITLKQVTNKEVLNIPFWANNEIFFEIKDKDKLREKYKINRENFLIGSFQRDSEGSDLTKPKLIKGPDIFISAIKKLSENNKNIEVILSGNRRNYIIKELQKNNIEYRYFKNINNTKLNELYNMLDMYIVSSRLEGGPQAILECGLTKTPLISTDVGIASQILHTKSIFSTNPQNAIPDTDYAYQNTLNLAIPNGMKKFRSELSKL